MRCFWICVSKFTGLSCVLFTARIRRMGEGNIFTLCVSPHPEEYPHQVLMGGTPILPTRGYPILTDRGYPILPNRDTPCFPTGGTPSFLAGGYPILLDKGIPIRTGWGTSNPHQDWIGRVPPTIPPGLDGGTPHPLSGLDRGTPLIGTGWEYLPVGRLRDRAATLRAGSLLRSYRRTFLFVFIYVVFSRRCVLLVIE